MPRAHDCAELWPHCGDLLDHRTQDGDPRVGPLRRLEGRHKIRTAAVELAKHHITVNAVEPGPILSDGVAALLDQKTLDEIAAPVPMGKLGDPEDVAHVLLFFASDEAKYVTGQTLVVDGGCILPEFLTQTG